MNTLALSPPTQLGGWDLFLDNSGNIALNRGGAALAQDVASAVRTFRGEVWYDTTRGVPYYQQILGRRVSLQFLKQALVSEGLIVPNVAAIACFLTGPGRNRYVGGQLQITSANGQILVINTGDVIGALPWWVSGADEVAVGADT